MSKNVVTAGKVKIFFGKKTGYRSKDLVLPTAGIYEVTPEQKEFFLGISGGFWYEPDSPEAKAWLAMQKSAGSPDNAPPGSDPGEGEKTGLPDEEE